MPSTGIVITHTFATQSGNIPLSTLDTNFAQLTGVVNNLNSFSNYFVDTGIANSLSVAIPSSLTGTLAAGLTLQVLVANTNTGVTTITLTGGIASAGVPIKTQTLAALVAGQLVAGGLVTLVYDGTQFQLQGTPPAVITAASGVALVVNAASAQPASTFTGNQSNIVQVFNTTGGSNQLAGIVFGSAGDSYLSGGIFGSSSTANSGALVLQYVTGGALTSGITILATGQVNISQPTSTTVPGLSINSAQSAVATFFNATAGGSVLSGITFGSTGATVSGGVFGQSVSSGAGNLLLQYVTGNTLTTGLEISSVGAVTIPGTLGVNGAAGAAAVTGWGAPVNYAVVNNYNATTEGGTNTTKAVAYIIYALKSLGVFAA